MISKSIALEVLNACLATGGDYAEIYVEQCDTQSVTLENGKVETGGDSQTYGAGIRIYKQLQSVFGFTNDLSKSALLSLAEKLSSSFKGERIITVESIKKMPVKCINPVKSPLNEVSFEEKVAYLKSCYESTKAVSPLLVRIIDQFYNEYVQVEIFSADGSMGKQYQNIEQRGRLVMEAIAASEDHKIETYFSGPGKYDGWDYFTKTLDYLKEARVIGEKAVMMLNAKECPSGRFPVVITNGWGGVLFHEACGHSLEATSTAKGLSVFSNSIGEQIASPLVSAYDDGTIPNEWGSNNIDSEGRVTQKVQLIKDGICTGFLVDQFNARRLKMAPTGCARRQSYRYAPTSRMSNTYIDAGKDNPEDIIKDTKLGIYVANFGGGSVEPTTGEFNFSASEAYIIRDGKICEPVKGCTLIGTGKEVLMNIDRVGNDLAFGVGYCGSSSGSVPVTVGQPTIRLKEITVGGRGGKLE